MEAGFNPGGFGTFPHLHGTFTGDSVTIEVFVGVALDSESFYGTYEVLEGGACTGETGTIEASLSVPLQGPVAWGESVTLYDDLGNSTTYVLIEGLDPHTGRSRWTQRQLAALVVPERSPDEPSGHAKLQRRWWALQDSNLGPSDYESLALTD